MPGSLTVPNVIAAQAGPTVAASLFDANWNQIRDYVNNREITQGTLAARPAASIEGRWYFATDTGQLFADTGAAWTEVAARALGGYRVVGLVGVNNAGTPNTQFDLDADVVTLHNPSDGSIAVRRNPGSITNNVSTAGPAANGRDQAGAFGASSWIHFYYIWNGTTLATVSSATAPTGAAGPVMPTGYTHWAYAGAVRYNATPLLVRTRFRGSWATYDIVVTALSAGTATVETSIDISALIPPNALMYFVIANVRVTTGLNGTGFPFMDIRPTNTGSGEVINCLAAKVAATDICIGGGSGLVSNISQTLYYIITEVGDGTDTTEGYIFISAYSMPNGGE